MWWKLDERLLDVTTRQIRAFETYRNSVHDENARRKRRTNITPDLLSVHEPETWALDPGFNPYRVRARRHAIAHSVTGRLRMHDYSPRRPAGFVVPKPSGGSRTVSTFQIVDEAISNRLLRSLTRKNLPRLSSRAYAYRPDVTPHDAIHYVQSEFRREHRLFVAEYDFSKFFDTVRHDYLFEALDRMAILRTPLEDALIREFLKAPEPYLRREEKHAAVPDRDAGIPQGTSVSLFFG